MRKDLNKLLCERERVGHSDHYGYYRRSKRFDGQHDVEDTNELFTGVGSGHRESMTARHGTKSFNENLNPLYGFIRKSLGKKWDKVYSEICEVFDKRSVINQHILIHLFQYVETNVRVGTDGKLYVLREYTNEYIPVGETSTEYYVDPRDGILKYNHARLTQRQEMRAWREERQRRQLDKKRVLGPMLELERVDGIWYEFQYAPVERWARVETDENGYERTVYYSSYVRDSVSCPKDGERAIKAKRQLSHKELKRYGLTNEFKEAA
jgi:hypothetical protein